MSSEIAIKVDNLSKCHEIYEQPRDRLKQFVLPRFRRLFGLQQKQYYRGFWAINNVSFDIKRGETIGIIGRNGSGKSTLLQMVCGTLNQTTGNIQTHGRIAALLELGSGFNPDFTGRENVYLNGSVLGLSKKEIDARFDEITLFADIGDFIEQPVKTYSSGMVVRLAFAVAVAVQPDILVVDEALSVGDEAFQRKCFARIEEIRRAGGTILFVTHATQLVVEMCDRAILLREGKLIYFGDSHWAVNLYYKFIGKSSGAFNSEPIKEDSSASAQKMIGENSRSVQAESAQAINELASDGHFPVDYMESMPAFDVSLVSQTSHEIHEEKFGVTISNIGLQSFLSEKVNILSQGERYVVAFDVEFTRSPHNISYQILFKTVNGIPIAGDRFFHEQTFGSPASAGNKQRVIYEFQCLMNPGVYFISIEACGDEGEENVVYHKFAERLAFRVLGKGRNTAIGYTSVMPRIETKGF